MIISAYYSHFMAAVRQTGKNLEEIAEDCMHHHLTGFDVIYSQINDECLKNIEILKNCGMKMCSLPAHTDFVHNPDKQLAKTVVDTAKALGASVIMAIPGFFNEGDDKEKARQLSLGAIEYMQSISGDIHIGVEDYDDFNSAVAGIEGVGWYLDHNSSLHAIFDTGNFEFMGDDTLEAFNKFKDRIKYQIHCNDKLLTPVLNAKGRERKTGAFDYPAAVGSGVLPHTEILTELVKSGFDGIITIENFGSPNALCDLCSSAEFIYKTVLNAGGKF